MNGVLLASIFCRDDLHSAKWDDYAKHLTCDEARRIAKAIAKIPEFMKPRPGFDSRCGGDKRWKASHPYHVALQDWYVRESWDRITAMCAYNGIPFDPTGERINREGHWCVYEFTRQINAAMFWDEFKGRWLRHKEFFYPDRPDDLPKMKAPPNLEKEPKVAVMKNEQHVAQIGADMAIQLMLMTLFRIVADTGDNPNKFLSDVRTALLDLATNYPLPQLPPGVEKEVRDAAQMVITGVMSIASAPHVH